MGSKSSAHRILFLEDEVILTLTFEEVLRELGLGEVVTAHTLAEAARTLEEGPVHVAVLDLNVGGATSVGLAKRVIEQGGEVVFATGQAEDSHEFEDLPCQLVLKPYEERALKQAVLAADERASSAKERRTMAG